MVAVIALPHQAQVSTLLQRLAQTSQAFADWLGGGADARGALRRFGLRQWRANDLAGALEALLAAQSLGPEDGGLWRDLAGAYAAAGDDERAQLCTLRALRHDDGHVPTWLMLAGLRQRHGDDAGAEAAYRQALALDATQHDAELALGLLCFGQRRFDQAATHLRRALVGDCCDGVTQAILAQALYLTGDLAGALATFDAAVRLAPLDVAARCIQARARALHGMIEGRTEAALAAYRETAEAAGEDAAAFLAEAFAYCTSFEHRAAAAEIARIRLARAPDDPTLRYLRDAAGGLPLSCAPVGYVEHHFDGFAAEFDRKLVGELQYRVPAALCDMIARHRREFAEALDLGCGTGLAAEPLAAFGARLTGVDLSRGMLDLAAARGRYAALVKAEACDFLAAQASRFDLVLAADLLIYLGRLERLFTAVATALQPGGMLALSIETGPADDLVLLPTGRFAHAPAYVERVARADFLLLETAPTTIRLEATRPVAGALLLFRRRGSDVHAGIAEAGQA